VRLPKEVPARLRSAPWREASQGWELGGWPLSGRELGEEGRSCRGHLFGRPFEGSCGPRRGRAYAAYLADVLGSCRPDLIGSRRRVEAPQGRDAPAHEAIFAQKWLGRASL
jgi:hypothetical protein